MRGLVAVLPIVLMLIIMIFFKISVIKASALTLASSLLLASSLWQFKINDIVFSIIEGAIMALWPIGIVVIAALFLYYVCDKSGSMKIICKSMGSLTQDPYLLVLIVVYGFGSIIEGIAGFTASIAVSAPILCALGFPAYAAALISALTNPISSVFGSLGVQMPTLATVTGISAENLSQWSAIIVIPMIIVTPFVIIFVTKQYYSDISVKVGTIILALTAGIVFSAVLYITAVYISSDLAGLLGAVASTFYIIVVVFLKNKHELPNKGDILKYGLAWSPFGICILLLIITSKINTPLYSVFSRVSVSIPIAIQGVVSYQKINILCTAAIWIFISGLLSACIYKLSVKSVFQCFYDSVHKMKNTLIVLILLIATARIMTHSGMISDMATSVVDLFGRSYVYAVPLMGSIGAFITGSATSANVLLGNLQVSVSEMLAVNSAQIMGLSIVGGTLGKMISPQSLSIAMSSVNKNINGNKLFKQLLLGYAFYLLLLSAFGVIILNI